MAILQVVSGAYEGKRFALTGSTVSVGREPENDVCLPFSSLSRRHAILARKGDDYELRDLNSTNGTFVNGEQVTRFVLTKDAPIRFGQIELLYSAQTVETSVPVAAPIVLKVAPDQPVVAPAQSAPVVVATPQPAPKIAEPVVAARPKVEFRIGSVLKKRGENEPAGKPTSASPP